MKTIQEVATFLDVKNDEIEYREWIDSFNPTNSLQGYICRRSDHRYGCLVITKINNVETEQLIWATPKLEYPFDRQGTYHWPDVKAMEFYEKLDGTNICAYHYMYKEKQFVSYKTRLTPVVKDQKFGLFKSMWNDYLTSNAWIEEAIFSNPSYNLSFELYGARNPITINYSVPLDVCLLFGIDRLHAHIVPPSTLFNAVKIPTRYAAESKRDLTEVYNKFREEMSLKNKDALTVEGMVMYASVVGEKSYRQFKVKPEEIERIHWSASGVIPEKSIFNTALNSFEEADNPTVDTLKQLLREEYSPELITKNNARIQNIWEKAVAHIEFTKQVNEVWALAKQEGLDITKDKGATMRFMSKHFPKGIMRRVGSIILKQVGLL